jgi:AmmeMemoRadiSam system protein A
VKDLSSPLSPNEKDQLLTIARRALQLFFEGDKAPWTTVGDGGLDRVGGAFVTLEDGPQLRGCMGVLASGFPLAGTVAECAVSAASRDPRFSSVEADEVQRLKITVSVLGEFKVVAGPEDVVIGKHGILISQGHKQGLLLPQVATELQLEPAAFLDLGCQKAVLPAGSWREGASIQVFTAEVFSDAL